MSECEICRNNAVTKHVCDDCLPRTSEAVLEVARDVKAEADHISERLKETSSGDVDVDLLVEWLYKIATRLSQATQGVSEVWVRVHWSDDGKSVRGLAAQARQPPDEERFSSGEPWFKVFIHGAPPKAEGACDKLDPCKSETAQLEEYAAAMKQRAESAERNHAETVKKLVLCYADRDTAIEEWKNWQAQASDAETENARLAVLLGVCREGRERVEGTRIDCGTCGRDTTPSGDCYGCEVDRLTVRIRGLEKDKELLNGHLAMRGVYVATSPDVPTQPTTEARGERMPSIGDIYEHPSEALQRAREEWSNFDVDFYERTTDTISAILDWAENTPCIKCELMRREIKILSNYLQGHPKAIPGQGVGHEAVRLLKLLEHPSR